MVLMKRWSIIRCRMSSLLLPTICNGQQNIYKKYSNIYLIYIYTKAEILIDWLRRSVVQFRIVMSVDLILWYTERKKYSHLTNKVESLAELKFDPAKWVTGEYLSQIDSTLRVELTQHWDSTFKVKMTQFFLSVHWEKKLSHLDLKSWVEFCFHQWLNFLGQMTQFFYRCTEKKIESF